MKKISVPLFFLAAVIPAITAYNDCSAGTAALGFLTQTASPRTFSMGSVLAGLSDDANTIYANPAGLAVLKGIGLTYSNSRGQLNDIYNSYTYAKKGFGIGYLTYDGGNIKAASPGNPSKALESESGSITTISLALDGFISEHWGINYKFIKDSLANDYSADAQAYDVGIMYTLFSNYSAGLVAQNLGSAVKYGDARVLLPRQTVAGVSYKTDALILEMDDIYYPDGTSRINYGAEMKFGRAFFLRGGYTQGAQNAQNIQDTTLGAGLLIGKLQIDYGTDMSKDLNKQQKFSLSLVF